MHSFKINIIAAVATVLIALAAFIIIYQDVTSIPEYNGVFVCSEEVIIA